LRSRYGWFVSRQLSIEDNVTHKYSSVGTKVVSAVAGLAFLFLGGSSSDSASVPLEPVSKGGPPVVMRLITTQQYQNAVQNIFGADIKMGSTFPALNRTQGLKALGATTAIVTPGLLDVYDRAARVVAAQVVDMNHRDVFVHCRPRDARGSDDKCARDFLGKAGRLLFRRSLTPAELETYAVQAQKSAQQFQDFYVGLQYGLAGLLVAPEFIHLIQKSEPDPTRPGEWRLDGVSKATRLSLLVWDAPPDEELLRAAEKGELHTAKGLERQVERMVTSTKIESGVRAFFNDMFVMETFDNLAKDAVIYPAFTQQVVTDAREQMLKMVVDHLVARNGDYRDLFTTRRIFLTRALNAVYGIPAPTTGTLDWVSYDLPENDPRAGILTQLGFLSSYAHPGRSSATKRGKAVREIFMCQRVPDPPANVDFSAVEEASAELHTARERLTVHMTNPACSGCHRITDPIGLALENFDGAGQYRLSEGGAAIDSSGDLNGKKFADAKGLAMALHDSPALTSCLVKRVYEYGVGRPTGRDEKPTLTYLEERFAEQKFNFTALLRTIATSSAFYHVDKE
jgi:hypothetical protein